MKIDKAKVIVLGFLCLVLLAVVFRERRQPKQLIQPVSENIDANLVGSWDTGCLVSNTDPVWTERHTMILNANGSGRHNRYSGVSCTLMTADSKDEFRWVVTKPGQIDMIYTVGMISGNTVYDIYKIASGSAVFGQGFCNCIPKNYKYGTSEKDRFDIFNDFLVYKKQ
jgi:hypothetical protein